MYNDIEEDFLICHKSTEKLFRKNLIDENLRMYLDDYRLDDSKKMFRLFNVVQSWTTVKQFHEFITIITEQQPLLGRDVRTELIKHLPPNEEIPEAIFR